jgi:hypothetical protein
MTTAMPGHAVAWSRDASHLVVAWRIAPVARLQALRALGPRARRATAALRLVPDRGATPIWDLPPDAGARVLEVGPATRYVVEIGIRADDGTFVALARTPGLTTAPLPAAADDRVTWVHAAAPDVPVQHAWSGRRVRLPAPPADGPRTSDLHSRA